MTDQPDNMDTAENFDADLGFEDTFDQPQKGGNKALMKMALIAIGVVAVVVAIFVFGSGSGTDTGPKSEMAQAPSDDQSLPGQKEPTPEIRQAIESYNQQIIEEAKQTGQSVVPIPIDPARQQLQTKVQETKEDPAERFRRIQEEYRRQQELQLQQRQGQQNQASGQADAEIIQGMAQAMSGYLNTAMSTRQPRATSSISVGYTAPPDPSQAGTGGVNSLTGEPGSAPVTMADAKVLIPAATIEYGQLLIEANTDAPGPVLAMMASGPYSGARLLGSFQKTDEYLTISFNQMVTKDGEAIPVQAIVLDPTTTLPGVITEINRRYLQRYVLPAAADFISGVGGALAETQTSQTQTSSSTTTSQDEPNFDEAISQGISDSFDGLADALEDSSSKAQPMLRVAAGTPIGILFTQPVLDPRSVEEIQAQIAASQPADPNFPTFPGMMQTGFPSMMPYAMVPMTPTASVAGTPEAAGTPGP